VTTFPLLNCLETAQPPLAVRAGGELTVAIGSLALGGAERVVLDWAQRVQPAWQVHLVVLRDHANEWTAPSSVTVTRLGGVDVLAKLTRVGAGLARSGIPVCVCHLLTAAERDALGSGGAFVVPVVHNAAAGWLEEASALRGARQVIAVSEATADDLRLHGCAAPVSVIRHIPRARRFASDARARWRRVWRVPVNATVIGMIGAVKPQKDYGFALRLLRALNARRDVYLVILGGPIGRNGRDAWLAVLDQMRRAGVRDRLAMPGFVADAAACLPAIDLLLNTSDYEGLSIATLEAIVNGVPVVASRVGGQGELGSAALALVGKTASRDAWIDAVMRALGSRPARPSWAGFPSHRLWTLAHLARPFARNDRVLFVTANLNAGGAQRSLVNLARALRDVPFEIAVTGDSTADYFFAELCRAGVAVHRTAASRDPFDHAERLVQKICAECIGTICFWNVDPKIKLLLAKALAFTSVALIDVSPGPHSFAEMRRVGEFARLIAFSNDQYYQRLDRIVLKYRGAAPASSDRDVSVIPNGVPAPARTKTRYDVAAGHPRIVVNGRIAPTKFIVEIVQATQLVRTMVPGVELHIFGSAEPRHRDYGRAVDQAVGDDAGRAVFFHGAAGDTVDRLAEFDAFVVLGEDQGSPNALLEALAAGLPCIANDDGGTAEQIVHERTGLLLPDRAPATLARAIVRILGDRALAARLGEAGRAHALESFSMTAMAARYESLFASLAPARLDKEMTA
jgi:glycosyltransferase involved in cell wall biosynthesis